MEAGSRCEMAVPMTCRSLASQRARLESSSDKPSVINIRGSKSEMLIALLESGIF